MSTTAKIDFEPGLFDEGQPEAAPDLPTIQPKRRASRGFGAQWNGKPG